MGEVHRAHDTRLSRTVAIKVLPTHFADPEHRARFEREAHTIAGLSHPHICTLYDVGEHGSSLFLVMEHLSGETLAERLSRGALPVEEALALGADLADALSAAHRAGIVHRDLKPGNIMLTKAGVKLLDFGLAKPVGQPAVHATALSTLTRSAPLTGEGTILGTLQYMAPEQLEGGDTDARTDIWALGTVLYEMITGGPAFEGKSQASLIAAILEHDPCPVSSLQPLTPPALERLVRKCLAKDPDARWQSASDLADELRWTSARPTAVDGAPE
jgi:serine/threonine protein kinase